MSHLKPQTRDTIYGLGDVPIILEKYKHYSANQMNIWRISSKQTSHSSKMERSYICNLTPLLILVIEHRYFPLAKKCDPKSSETDNFLVMTRYPPWTRFEQRFSTCPRSCWAQGEGGDEKSSPEKCCFPPCRNARNRSSSPWRRVAPGLAGSTKKLGCTNSIQFTHLTHNFI